MNLLDQAQVALSLVVTIVPLMHPGAWERGPTDAFIALSKRVRIESGVRL